MALSKLGRNDEAKKIFDELIENGHQKLAKDTDMNHRARFGEKQTKEMRTASAHYILGLGYSGNGQRQKAKSQFRQAVKLNINHIWAASELSGL